jgi:thymidine phosphorylase
MYVFKIIKRIFDYVYSPMSVETNQLLMEEADVIMKNIKAARMLSELLEQREVLRKFRGAVELAGSPRNVKQKLVFLEAQWNRQFRLWKSRG